MANSLFVASTEGRSGKTAVCLGLMEMLARKINRVGFFRPIINPENFLDGRDRDIVLISSHFQLNAAYEEMFAFTTEEAERLRSEGREPEVIEGILNKFHALQEKNDFILCEGIDFPSSTSAFVFEFNTAIARNLASPVLLVVNGRHSTLQETLWAADLSMTSACDETCEIIAVIVNQAEPRHLEAVRTLLQDRGANHNIMTFVIPHEPTLAAPSMGEIARAIGAKVLYGGDQLNRHAYKYIVAAMQLRNLLPRIEHGSLIITPGDRADVIVACLAAVSSRSMDDISGVVMTGGLLPEEPIIKLIEGFPRIPPVLSVESDTFATATAISRIVPSLTPDNDRKITRALASFEKHVNVNRLAKAIITTKTTVVTPKMFEYGLIQRARSDRRRIVLPEGGEERILRAAEILTRREAADLVLLGGEEQIRERISRLGLRLDGIRIIDPKLSDRIEDFAETYYNLRKHKGITPGHARDVMEDVNFFGTMMVHQGLADGMVSGAVHTTLATVRPAFEIIKTKPGCSIVSSVFFMCLADRVLAYGDCAVNPNPTAPQLAEIALASAQTALTFGLEPRVAMLSYSTGESGQGEDVDKVREATRLARELAELKFPGLKIEGPIQYDAAVDAAVALTKMPDSEVAGKATVFIFPDLNTGNNTYKAVQRSSGAVAIGPVLQGLKHPVNDLSRGCLVTDIVNTVAITAIQAQSEKGLS
ncbi:MAG: phosphate acetyltransferase [Pseudomonadota bacterium]